MKIGIIGYDLFGTGGTKRSNINLINELLISGAEVTYYNLLPFTRKKMERTVQEISAPEQLVIKELIALESEKKEAICDAYILTRESLFSLARPLKNMAPKAKIIAEIHAPIDLIPVDLDFAKDAVDVYRVATEGIKEALTVYLPSEKIKVFPVSTNHIRLNQAAQISDTSNRNLLVYSRFDEQQKDIAYSIRLVDYLVHQLNEKQTRLFLNGTGPGMAFYQELIRFYKLEEYVFINHKIPKEYTYLSTSRYETLGYSILESFSTGKDLLLYVGDDHSLKEIYGEFQGISWLTKMIPEDATTVVKLWQKTAEEKKQNLKNNQIKLASFLEREEYGKKYQNLLIRDNNHKNVMEFSGYSFDKEIQIVLQRHRVKKNSLSYQVYLKLRSVPVIGKVVQSEKLKKQARRIGNLRLKSDKNQLNQTLGTAKLDPQAVFIESFHGRSFAGDPKYMALYLKHQYPEMRIFVSSINSFVDMEIYSYGFKPVRIGSPEYSTQFQKSTYVFMNGNSLDKVGKQVGQIFVQTWHGFPLKKMVADLQNEGKRKEETSAFLPRMKKWDYLLSSSPRNTELFTSAFQVSENKDLKILEMGAPRNEYLIRYKDDVLEKEKIFMKYFNRSFDAQKKYILYCPTWRNNKRKQVSEINLTELVARLPEQYELIIKLHPLESDMVSHYNHLDSRIHCFLNECSDIQELFLLSEVLITDYSSAMFDFAHLGRKIIILQEDLEEYQQRIGWYFDLGTETKLYGAKHSLDELVSEILAAESITDTGIVETFLSEDSLETCCKIGEIVLNKEENIN